MDSGGAARRPRRPARAVGRARRRDRGRDRASAEHPPTTSGIPSYYLHYFTSTNRVLAEQQGRSAAGTDRSGDRARAPADVSRSRPGGEAGRARARGGAFYSEAAVGLVRSLSSDDGAVTSWIQGTGARSQGLADDDVVEVPARVTAERPVALEQRRLRPSSSASCSMSAAYERLTAGARSRERGRGTEGLLGASLIRTDRAGRRPRRLACRGGSSMSALSWAFDGATRRRILTSTTEGHILSLVHGPGQSPHEHGVDGALDRIEASARAGAEGPVAMRSCCSPRSTFTRRSWRCRRGAAARLGRRASRWRTTRSAVLRAGTDRGWGIAVVCGAGHRLPRPGPEAARRAFRHSVVGRLSVTWGAARTSAPRLCGGGREVRDGRGPRTAARAARARAFRLSRRARAGGSLHTGAVPRSSLRRGSRPLVFAEAERGPGGRRRSSTGSQRRS